MLIALFAYENTNMEVVMATGLSIAVIFLFTIVFLLKMDGVIKRMDTL